MSGTVPAENTLQSDSTASIKATKVRFAKPLSNSVLISNMLGCFRQRKLDDALFNLEQALRSSDDVQRPPTKKMKFPASLYSTLAKYGIKTKSKDSTRSVILYLIYRHFINLNETQLESRRFELPPKNSA